MNLVLAITTYNRINYLKELIDSWFVTRNTNYSWKLIIADDGSTDGTKDYLMNIDYDNILLIFNERKGVSVQTNKIFKELNYLSYDICFKCDDDIIFTKNGWDDLYCKSILNSPIKHICYENSNFNVGDWCKDGILKEQIIKEINGCKFIARTDIKYTKGCFYTITKDIQDKIGYMDSHNFFHGYEHIDYTIRCSRKGFNNKKYTFDCYESNDYVSYRFPWNQNQPAIDTKQYFCNGNGFFSTYKKKLLLEDNLRIYIPYNESKKHMQNNNTGVLI